MDLSCDDEIMKIVDSDAYCGYLKNAAGPFADCISKMVHNTFVNRCAVLLSLSSLSYICSAYNNIISGQRKVVFS